MVHKLGAGVAVGWIGLVAFAGCATGAPPGGDTGADDPDGPSVTRVTDDAGADQGAPVEAGGPIGPRPDAAPDATDPGALLPVLAALAPSSAIVDTPGPTVVLTGKNFGPRSVVQVDGKALATSFVGATELRVTLPTTSLAKVGTLLVAVETPPPGGGRSAAVPFEVVNPQPTASGLTPASAPIHAPDTKVVVAGTGFVPTSVVTFEGVDLATRVTDATTVEATVPAARLGVAGTFRVSVRNPTPGGGISNDIAFVVSNPTDVSITSVVPSFATVGSAALPLTVHGAGFVAASVVSLNGTALTTTFTSDTELAAQIPASSLTNVGDLAVTVAHAQPGGGTSVSAPATFSVVNPAPAVAQLAPASAVAGAAPLTIAASGSGFVAASQLTFDGVAAATTFVSATELRATLTAQRLASAGSIAVRAVTPAPGGGTSTPVAFVVQNPMPAVQGALVPAAADVGSGNVMLTVTGARFVPGSVVRAEGSDLTTTYRSAGELAAVLPSTLFATAGTLAVTVANPAPGGGVSGPATFTVRNVAPTITGVAPSSVAAGAPSTTLAVAGRAFVPGATVYVGPTALTTTFVAADEVRANVPDTYFATAGTLALTVANPPPGGGASAPFAFTVSNPSVALTSVTPTQVTVGATNVALAVRGAGFVGASEIRFNGAALTTTFVSAGELQATLAGPLGAAGDFPVTVYSPPPGGGVSSALTLQVRNPVPVLSGVTPSTVAEGAGGSNGLTVTLTGSGFVAGVTTARASGTSLPTTVTGSTRLTAVVPASLVAASGTVPITVTNGTPGGGTSGAQNLTVTRSCDRTGVDVALTELDPALGASTTYTLAWTGLTSRPRMSAGTCPLTSLSTTSSQPVRSWVVLNDTSGPAVLSTWAVCTSGSAGQSDAFLATYKRGATPPTSVPATDAERMACTGAVSEGSSGSGGYGSPEAGGSSWCPGLTKANGAGLTLQRCERAVVQVQPYDTASTLYPPPATLKMRLETP